MAIAGIAVFTSPSPRHASAVSASRIPPRVYTPYPTRRLTRPMAVRADADTAGGVPGRTLLPFPFLRGRRDRSA
jgi:hypothetical protein